MDCFRVTFELVDPVIAPFGVSLDGLLAAAAVKAGAEFARAHLELPIAQTNDIFHASELFFVGPAQSSSVPYVRSLRPEQWDRALFRDGRGRPRNKVNVRDDLKNLLDKYESIATPAAVAWGVGNIDAVTSLLEHIDAIGKKAHSRGSGRLRSMQVEKVDADPVTHGLIDANRHPVRNLPIDLFNQLEGNPEARSGAAVCRLPRWKNSAEHCALPSTRFIRLEDIP